MEPQRRPRLITTVHGLYSVSAYSAIMTRGERIIAVSNTVRDYILNNYSVVDPARIVVIPRGIDPQAYPHGYTPPAEWMDIWRAQYPQLAGKKVLTLPGRITRLKGHEDFITLINRLIVSGEQVHGLIVGGAEDKKRAYLSELQKTIARLGLVNDITFTGHRGDLREIMAVSDIVLSLSSKPEAFGRTVLEAISLGSPVVGYAHGGVGELLSSLYPPGCAPMGDIDAVMRQCRSIDSGSLISAQSPLPTLQAMLSATLAVYANI
jgi:glycosyltransferase involved in cell wall biosynthesis